MELMVGSFVVIVFLLMCSVLFGVMVVYVLMIVGVVLFSNIICVIVVFL